MPKLQTVFVGACFALFGLAIVLFVTSLDNNGSTQQFYDTNGVQGIADVEIAQARMQPPDSFLRAVAADKERSGKWAALRKKVIVAHPYCAYCGGTEKLQSHHIRPFHLHPELELVESNVIVLCETEGTDHHLRIGHAGNFKDENPNVVEDCQKHEAEMRKAGTWPRK